MCGMNVVYKSMALELLHEGHKVGNTIELQNAQFSFDVRTNNIATCRDISLPYLFAEMTWYLAGSQSMKFISKFGSMWERISDDGETSNSAYGHIMFMRYGFDQLNRIIELLKKDPGSRRALININIPNPRVIETKDEPCTICLQFLIRDGKLDCTGMMRSNDIWYGLPYDIVFFTEVQKHIASELGIDVGTYTHFATSLHVYEKDIDKLEKAINNHFYEEIEVDFSRLWQLASKVYTEVNKADDPKEEIMRQFEKYGMYKR